MPNLSWTHLPEAALLEPFLEGRPSFDSMKLSTPELCWLCSGALHSDRGSAVLILALQSIVRLAKTQIKGKC